MPYLIPLVSLLVSVATFVFTAITWKQKANQSHFESLEQKVIRLEQALRACQAESKRLLEENVALMRQLVMKG